MAPSQLLARAPKVAHGDMEFMDPGPQVPVRTYGELEQKAPGRPIRLGTASLLTLAVALRDAGFRTTHLELTNSNFQSEPEGYEFVLEIALDLVRNESIERVLDFFRNQGRGYYVVAIEARAQKGGGRMTIRRDGWVTVHNSSLKQRIKRALQEQGRRTGIV
jgi:hypothetical protein